LRELTHPFSIEGYSSASSGSGCSTSVGFDRSRSISRISERPSSRTLRRAVDFLNGVVQLLVLRIVCQIPSHGGGGSWKFTAWWYAFISSRNELSVMGFPS